jgi:hypothetical protein
MFSSEQTMVTCHKPSNYYKDTCYMWHCTDSSISKLKLTNLHISSEQARFHLSLTRHQRFGISQLVPRLTTVTLIGCNSTVFLKVWSAAVLQVVRGGFKRTKIAKIVSDTERVKNTPYISLLRLSFLVDLQQKVGELVLSTSSWPSMIIL